jgi:putative intracellular protease/amidase
MNPFDQFKRFCLAIALMWTASGLVARAEPPVKAEAAAKPAKQSRTVGIVLYPMFELLDVYGPAEIFGNVNQGLKIVMVAEKAGPVISAQGPQVLADYGFDDCPPLDLILVPGGMGTLAEIKNPAMLDWLRLRAKDAEIVMSVCSGSAILAKAGLLDGRKATSNKRYFQVAVDQGPKVQWIERARWVDDGDRVTLRGFRPASICRWRSSHGSTARSWPKRLPSGRSTNGIATPTTIPSLGRSPEARLRCGSDTHVVSLTTSLGKSDPAAFRGPLGLAQLQTLAAQSTCAVGGDFVTRSGARGLRLV